MGESIRSHKFPVDFKGTRKVPNYNSNMDPASWIATYELAMGIMDVDEAICARYLTMMLEGSAQKWLDNLPANMVHTCEDLKGLFIKNFEGTCKRATTIEDLEHCMHKEGESSHRYMNWVSDIINTSDSITHDSAIGVLKKNCRFETLMENLRRSQKNIKSLIDLMEICNTYAESDKTKDASDNESEKQKGKKNVGEKNNNNAGKRKEEVLTL